MLQSLADLWIKRRAAPVPEALTAVGGLKPAIVVTGGSRGLGLALARAFARAGSDIVLIARNATTLTGAAQALMQATPGTPVHTLALDAAGPTAARDIEGFLASNGLFLDVLINNAGSGLGGPFVSHAQTDIDALVSLNVAALTRLTRHALPGMLARGRGGILNVSSLGGLVPGPNQAAYYASKAYVISLSEAIASEVSGRGVRVCVLAPGPIETSFHENMEAGGALYRTLLPSLRPERVADAAYQGYRLGRRVVIPGFINIALTLGARVMPHALLVPLIGVLLDPRKMPETANPGRK